VKVWKGFAPNVEWFFTRGTTFSFYAPVFASVFTLSTLKGFWGCQQTKSEGVDIITFWCPSV
jgi:hypothetical protein